MRSERLAPAKERAARREASYREAYRGVPRPKSGMSKYDAERIADTLAEEINKGKPALKPGMEVSRKKKVDLDDDSFGGDDGI